MATSSISFAVQTARPRVVQKVITSYNPPTPTECEDGESEPWQDSAAWQDLLSYDGDRIGGAL